MNLIVGGSGFIGGHLCEHFFAEGEISKGIFRKGSHLRIMDQCGVQCLEADLTDRHTLHEPLDMVDVVYNLASPPPGAPEVEFDKFNDVALRNLLEEADEHGTKVFVHLSPLDVYGFGEKEVGETTRPAPSNNYQRAKLRAEDTVREFGKSHPDMRVAVVRAARGIGSRDKTVVLPILRMMQEGKVTLPATSSPISFSHPRDIAQALLRAANSNEKERAIIVKSFDASLEEVANAITGACGKRVPTRSQGIFSKSAFSPYATELLKSAPMVSAQDSWKVFNYAPTYDLGKASAEIALWSRKEPWLTEDLA